MKSKTKSEPISLKAKAAALALMASELLALVLAEPIAAAGGPLASVVPVIKLSKEKVPKPGKRKGRPPMTEEQRAAAKADREVQARRESRLAEASLTPEERSNRAAVLADVRPKPQPVTRASLAARNAVGQAEPPSYFTKAS